MVKNKKGSVETIAEVQAIIDGFKAERETKIAALRNAISEKTERVKELEAVMDEAVRNQDEAAYSKAHTEQDYCNRVIKMQKENILQHQSAAIISQEELMQLSETVYNHQNRLADEIYNGFPADLHAAYQSYMSKHDEIITGNNVLAELNQLAGGSANTPNHNIPYLPMITVIKNNRRLFDLFRTGEPDDLQ